MIGLPYSLQAIAHAVGGRLVLSTEDGAEGLESNDLVVDRALIDSRGANATPGTLFIALKGPRHDGHDHIAEVLRKGVAHVMVNEDRAKGIAGANLIVVPDTLVALQLFAAHHRMRSRIPVIGITGSNGKTVVKEWLWQMLHQEENIVRSPGSWNSQVGVPLSVLRMGQEHTLAIFEAGISRPGEMERLEPIIRPTIGVFTMLGDAHDDGFRDLPSGRKAAEKMKLFERADIVVRPVDLSNPLAHGISLAGDGSQPGAIQTERAPTIEVVARHIEGESTVLLLRTAEEEHAYRVPFTDLASVSNAMTCIAVCLLLGRKPHWIDERLAVLAPVDMRMRTLQGVHGTTLVDDSYSLDLTSLGHALDALKRMSHGRAMVAVLSDVAESDEAPAQLYRRMAGALAGAGITEVIGVGPVISAHSALFGDGASFHPDVDVLLKAEEPQRFAGAVVLIKGARSLGLERIVERWQQQVHGTELEIDLEAVRHNLNHFRAMPAPEVRMMVMLKAFGYGAGAVELARLLEHERVQYLGVAYADEGIELRTHGISLPIMVMNPEPVAMETLHRFRLEAEVYDQRSLQAAITAAQRMPDTPPVHIKLDTGMHRLGFTPEELPWLLDALSGHGSLKVASVLTHMVASEEEAHDAFTRAQVQAFTQMAGAIDAVLGYRPLRHMANSAGMARWPEAHFDMVRLGIGLHGIGAHASETALLRPTVALRTVVAQVKRLHSGDTVGYGRKGIVEGERSIATLPIGYADGFPRRLGNGTGCVWIQGKRAPVIGNVCMDMCMVDVTGITCAVGDTAVVFDADHPATELASLLGTIPYEVLTSISQRVKRVYVRH